MALPSAETVHPKLSAMFIEASVLSAALACTRSTASKRHLARTALKQSIKILVDRRNARTALLDGTKVSRPNHFVSHAFR
jgi:hypothetical protein